MSADLDIYSKTPINVILVRPIYSRNVGSVARTMANMGADKLILINPQCKIDSNAREGAAGAQKHLLESTTYATWSDFFENEPDSLRIAFTARNNLESDNQLYPDRLKTLIANNEIDPAKQISLIFGPEDSGLANDDLEFANCICSLPIYGKFKSLNLSHAALLALYITLTTLNRDTIERETSAQSFPSRASTNNQLHSKEKFYFPEEAIKDWLVTLGFKIGDRRIDAYKVLKRILLKNISTSQELRVLESVIMQTIRKLKNNKHDL